MTKPRVHKVWFTPVSRKGRKSCSNCHVKLPQGELIYSCFEYHNVCQRHIQDFCVNCWDGVRKRLKEHSKPCGCTFELVGYHCTLPQWLTLTP
jgi:hypothetical protein